MKKYLFITIVTVFAILPFSNLEAQFAIPSYDVELIGSSITFEENHPPQALIAEERKINIRTTSESESDNAWNKITIRNKNTSINLGLFLVYEGSPFELNINDDEWEVIVLEYSPNAITSVWVEDLP